MITSLPWLSLKRLSFAPASDSPPFLRRLKPSPRGSAIDIEVTFDAWKRSFGRPLVRPLNETREPDGFLEAEPKFRQPLTPSAAFTGSATPLWDANWPPTVCGPAHKPVP